MSARPSLGQEGPVSPAFTREQRQRAIDRGAMRIDPEQGLEKFCRQCGEWWPADSEFWPLSMRDGLHRDCKVCNHERRYWARFGGRAPAPLVHAVEQKFLQTAA